jgi:ribosomal protein L3 glutamine methyltransferase
MKLAERIHSAAQQLEAAGLAYGHGTTNAYDEAAWLVLWALGLPLDFDIDNPQDTTTNALTDADLERIEALLQQRITTRKPTAYLTQEAWLQGVSFYVDERVIIPRSFIAELVVNGGLDYWLHPDTTSVLDLCTGNGSLAILAALSFPDIQLDAADISSDALAVASINVQRHGLQNRIQLFQSDGLAQLQGSYDLILCNPPYVNAQSMTKLPAEYQAEPALALDGNQGGGSDGMDFIRELLQTAPRYMTPDAVLVLEVGNERSHFEAAFPTLQAIWLETSAGDDQVLLLTRSTLTE